jgi:hypothetical protein
MDSSHSKAHRLKSPHDFAGWSSISWRCAEGRTRCREKGKGDGMAGKAIEREKTEAETQ